MPKYVDGFVIPLPKKNRAAYLKMAQAAGKIWMEHGALQYFECLGDDLKVPFGQGYPKAMKLKPNETVIFSWIVYRSRAHRDKVNAKVMQDPRIAAMCDEHNAPFDTKRMLYGGFSVMVGR
jgi:uncharacterized protein YbaA (DUF1428 family)